MYDILFPLLVSHYLLLPLVSGGFRGGYLGIFLVHDGIHGGYDVLIFLIRLHFFCVFLTRENSVPTFTRATDVYRTVWVACT